MTDRNLLNHGPGKGDKPRSKFDKNWAKRFGQINWPVVAVDGFVRKGHKQIKRY